MYQFEIEKTGANIEAKTVLSLGVNSDAQGRFGLAGSGAVFFYI